MPENKNDEVKCNWRPDLHNGMPCPIHGPQNDESLQLFKFEEKKKDKYSDYKIVKEEDARQVYSQLTKRSRSFEFGAEITDTEFSKRLTIALEQDKELDTMQEEFVEETDSIIKENKLNENLILFRDSDMRLPKTMKTYLRVSLRPENAKIELRDKENVYKYALYASKNLGYISANNAEELEILLPRNLKFHFVKKQGDREFYDITN